MAKQVITTTPHGSGLGDPAYLAFEKTNANFTEVYGSLVQTAAEITAGITPTNYSYPPGDVRRYGASGNGVADDTVACQNALNVAQAVTFPANFTFLCQTLTASQAGHRISGYGATLKLQVASANAALILNANGMTLQGLTVDCNLVPQHGILMKGDDVMVEECVIINFGAANIGGIYGTNNMNRARILNNKIVMSGTGFVSYGIYIECLTANAQSNKIINNYVDVSSNTLGNGIYITASNDPYTFKQSKGLIQSNRVVGSLIAGVCTGITYRGINGIVSGNRVTGFDLGISGDITSQSNFEDNVIDVPNGPDGYGIEFNGSYNSVVGNTIISPIRGIIATVDGTTQPNQSNLDSNTITGNTILDPSQYGIYFSAVNGGKTAYGNTFSGNSIRFTTAGTNRVGIALVNAGCLYNAITGNNIVGPGSGNSGGRAVRLDTTGGSCAILGNRIQGFERPISLVSAGALAFTNVAVNGNDMTQDCPSPVFGLVVEGSATFGAGCSFMWNSVNGLPNNFNVIDKQLNQILNFTNLGGTPNSVVTAGIGSLQINTGGGAATTLWVKESGANTNTGWRGMSANTLSGVTGAIATGATVSHGLPGAPTSVVLTAMDGTPTAVFPSALGASTFTINYTGGGTHAFSWQASI